VPAPTPLKRNIVQTATQKDKTGEHFEYHLISSVKFTERSAKPFTAFDIADNEHCFAANARQGFIHIIVFFAL